MLVKKPQLVYFLDQLGKNVQDVDTKRRLFKAVMRTALGKKGDKIKKREANLKLFKAVEAVKGSKEDGEILGKLCDIFPNVASNNHSMAYNAKYLDMNKINDFKFNNYLTERRRFLENQLTEANDARSALLADLAATPPTTDNEMKRSDLKLKLSFISSHISKIEDKLKVGVKIDLKENPLNEAFIRQPKKGLQSFKINDILADQIKYGQEQGSDATTAALR